MSNFFKELKRRNVLKEGIAYLVVSWMILQVSAIVFPLLGTPPWVMKTLLFLLVIGFPIWLIVAWLYEITPEGLKRNDQVQEGEIFASARRIRLNRIIIGALSIAVIFLLYDKFSSTNQSNKQTAIEVPVTLDKSIAVLPFENLSSEEDSQIFCDGVMEDILTNLAHLKDLKVISRTSSMHYRGTTKKLPEIAQELRVSYVLQGSVRKYQNKVRVVTQLINAKDDSHMWANNFDRELEIEKIFSIQSEIAYQIANALKVNISDSEGDVLDNTPVVNPKAYELVLEGRRLADDRSIEGLRNSVSILEEAVNLDPNFSDAVAELANSTWLLGYFDNAYDTEDAYNEAERLANQALTINANSNRAHSVLANIYFRTNRMEDGNRSFERALEISPSDATTHHQYSIFFDNQGNKEKAFFHSRKALEYDPLSLIVNYHYINLLMSSGLTNKAKRHLERMEILFDEAEDQFAGYYGRILMAEGKFQAAIPYFEKEMAQSKNYVAGELSYCYAKIGDKDKALELLELIPKQIYDLNASIVYFALNDKDKAYDYLEKCVDKGVELGTIKNDPVFNPYRSEARFVELLDRINEKVVE